MEEYVENTVGDDNVEIHQVFISQLKMKNENVSINLVPDFFTCVYCPL